MMPTVSNNNNDKVQDICLPNHVIVVKIVWVSGWGNTVDKCGDRNPGPEGWGMSRMCFNNHPVKCAQSHVLQNQGTTLAIAGSTEDCLDISVPPIVDLIQHC